MGSRCVQALLLSLTMRLYREVESPSLALVPQTYLHGIRESPMEKKRSNSNNCKVCKINLCSNIITINFINHTCKVLVTLVSYPDPPMQEIEKGSGQKGHTSSSQWNLT